MKVNMIMLTIGLFLIGLGAGTSDSGHFLLGAGIGLKGLSVLFFSIEQHRNPAWLKRQAKYLIWKLRS